MDVPVDKLIPNSEDRSQTDNVSINSGMPVENIGDMPPQSLREDYGDNKHSPINPRGCRSHTWRRWLVLGSALLLSIWGINEMRIILTLGQTTFVQYLFLV